MAINVGDLVANLRLDMSDFSAGVSRAQSRLGDLGGTMQQQGARMASKGKQLTAGVTAPIVGLGVAAFKTAADFESAMNNVEAVMDPRGQLDPSAMQGLADTAKELGATTVFSAKEAAQGMQFLAQAGFSASETNEAMAGTLALAAAGQLDLASAADISSNVLSGFGLSAAEADRSADVLATTASKANTSVQQMGEAMSFVAPVANSAGLDMENAAAAIGILGNAGIQGSRAGTTLSNAITKLLKPSTAAADVMNELGLNVQDAQGNLLPFDQIVRQLADSGANTAQLMEIFGLRAGPGMAALVAQGADSVKALEGDLREAGGTAQAMADTQMQGAAGAMARMKAAAEALMIAIGDSGLLEAVTGLVEKLGGFFTRLSETNPAVLKMVVVVAAVVAAIGPLLMMLGFAMQGFGALAAAAATVTAPMLLIPAAIAAVVAALVWLWNNNASFRDAVIAIWGRIQAAFNTAKEAIVAVFNFLTGRTNNFAAVLEIFGARNAQVIAKVKMVFQQLQEFLGTVLGVIQSGIQSFIELVSGWWARWGDDIMAFAKEAFDTVMGIISSALDAIMAGIEVFTDVAEALWRTWGSTIMAVGRRMFDILQNVIENAWNTIKQVFRGATTTIKGIFDAFAGLFTGDWSRMWEGIKSIFVGIWQVIEGIFGGIVDSVIDIVHGLAAAVGRIVGDLVTRVVTFFIDMGSRAISAVGDWLGRMKDRFFDMVGDMRSIGGDIIDGLIGGITDKVGSAVRAVRDAVSSVVSGAKSMLGISSPSRVFADIGDDTVAGLALGIKRKTGKAVRATQDMARSAERAGSVNLKPDITVARSATRAAISAMQVPGRTVVAAPMPSNGAMPSSFGSGAARPMQRANIVVELDGRQIMRAIGKPLVDEIRLRGGVRTV